MPRNRLPENDPAFILAAYSPTRTGHVIEYGCGATKDGQPTTAVLDLAAAERLHGTLAHNVIGNAIDALSASPARPLDLSGLVLVWELGEAIRVTRNYQPRKAGARLDSNAPASAQPGE
jgi:hypothetical protein